jgi:Leucine-rich repeat (LRR) protein
MAGSSISLHLSLWATLLFSLLSGGGRAASFNVAFLQGCNKSNNLTQLWLNSTGLSGPIPPEIGKCTALQVLSLRNNPMVNGSMPPEIGQLINLMNLDLRDTGLRGPIPPEIGRCAALQVLRLSNNSRVNGSIPAEIGQLTKLMVLDLGSTGLSGPIPSALDNLSSLEVLDLGSNNLTAPVPLEALCELRKLYYLSLNDNSQLTGPPPPPCVWNLTSLRRLNLRESPVFGGNPLSLESCQLVKLEWLGLGSTNLSGTIPPCLGNIPGLQLLSLSQNQLVGAIPRELGSLQNLTLAELQRNNLTGSIPEEFSDLAQLIWLDISNNQLSGLLPARAFEGLRQLFFLDLSNNSLTGPIRTEVGASGEALAILRLAHNNLSGAIPPGLGNLSNLTVLDLSYNQLSGDLPVELRGLRPSKLDILNLEHNNLTGGVGPIGHLTALSVIVLDNNNFSGPIPTAWFDSSKLGTLSLSFNSFSGPIPTAIRNMRPPNLAEVLAQLTGLPASFISLVEEAVGSIYIRLNSNQLSGSFPDIGRLNVSALIFNASDNKLLGTFRAGPFRKKKLIASFLELSNNGPLELLPGYNLSGWKLVSLPNISSGGGPLVAPDMRALTIAGRGIPSSSKLDLARLPATCPYVSYANAKVNDVYFWDACDASFGCVVNLIGTGSKLSRATRKRVCLGKISVFLEGDSPSINFV